MPASRPASSAPSRADGQTGQDSVRDDLVAYVRAHLAEPAAILVIDETGILKKGTKSAGVLWQYTETAGKRENCENGVFVAYSSWAPALTQVLLDRELYFSEEWASDWARRAEAGVPEVVTVATKPELARRMLMHPWRIGRIVDLVGHHGEIWRPLDEAVSEWTSAGNVRIDQPVHARWNSSTPLLDRSRSL
jgi:hypothetical protein